jgi:acetyl esterase/lipase
MRVRRRPSVRALDPRADRAARGPTRSARRQRRDRPVPQCERPNSKGDPVTSAFNTTLILALFAAMALRPPMPRHSSPFNLQFVLGWWINEVPLVGLWWIIAGTIGTLTHPEPSWWWWLVAAFTAVDVLLPGWIAVRARSARPALSAALQTVYGPRATPRYTRPAWWRLLLPVISWRPDVRRIRNRRYGPARRGNRLDVYVSRRGRAGAGPAPVSTPVVVYFHAAFGSKMLGSRALIYRLAAQGWVCVSAGRRQFRASYCDQLADARAALAWVRDNAAAYGGDPDRILASGGSAGAHLAATAAMTGSDVAGVIGLYGYYGGIGAGPGPTSPQQVINPDARRFSSFTAPWIPWSRIMRPGHSPTGSARSPTGRSFMPNFLARSTASTSSNPSDSTPSPTRSCVSRNSPWGPTAQNIRSGRYRSPGLGGREPSIRPGWGSLLRAANLPPRRVGCSDADLAGALGRAVIRIHAEPIVERTGAQVACRATSKISLGGGSTPTCAADRLRSAVLSSN